MGLFDFLKNKKIDPAKAENTKPSEPKKQSAKPAESRSDLFVSINKYSEYIVQYIGMQSQGNYAPISAYEKSNGEIIGFLYVFGEDASYSLSSEQAIDGMEKQFGEQMKSGEILSYVILYHSQFDDNENHTIANSDEELKAISVIYNFADGQEGKIGLPYKFEGDQVEYKGFNKISPQENDIIFNTKTVQGKDYFQHRETIVPPSSENEIGITIKKSNTLGLGNTWSGIFGFETFGKPNGGDILNQYFAAAIVKEPVIKRGDVSVSEIDFKDVLFKAITLRENPISLLPEVKTSYQLSFETKDITEWENVNNLEAIVSGKGRDTFGLWYFATDYAENRERYLTQKNLNVNISGIAFVLDIHTNDEPEGEVKYSNDFTMYMPNNDLPNYGCFDFIGELISFSESRVLENDEIEGYLINVKLITNEEDKGFFTIDIFVAKENMRFSELVVGMKLTGMFQMQGRIVD
ncbi:MAG: hypothetical protein P8P74_07710 [Crocinitomicaceae bacterium]|nr:hypothetical protein [Crocinitomicaceae bacterium]